MGGAKKKVIDDGSSTYSVVRMPGFKMDLHKQQQSLIFSDLNASRQKLADENQMLRDELAEAKMIIRLLKMKLEERDGKIGAPSTTAVVNSKDTTVKQGTPANFTKVMDRSKKKRYLFKQKTPSRREAFLNPSPPGARAFAVRRRSLSPPHLARRISPRSSFSPILGDATCERERKQQVSGFSVNDAQIEEVAKKMTRASISN